MRGLSAGHDASGSDWAFARNPLVEAARDVDPDTVARAERLTPAPTLFASGDLPAYTLSGIDPQRLLEVPWQARHAVATAASAEQVLGEYADDEQGMAAAFDFADSAANADYEHRVDAWLAQ